ncbi:MAG TPA: hypothetical protein VK462_07480 [Nitrososphaeraceae archaeon]|nr:hypothetical protein [Nitrososphaeraceae archaeon]
MIPNSEIKRVIEELQKKRVSCHDTNNYHGAENFTVAIQLLRQVLYNADVSGVRLSTNVERIE